MGTNAAMIEETQLGLTFTNFKSLTKHRLALSVVFSSLAGYLLAVQTVDWIQLFLLSFGGYCMVGASNGYNQVIEKDLDFLMNRTKGRPLPSGRMSVSMAMAISIILTILGIVSLYILNAKTAFFGALSIFLYTSIYTPLKTKTPLAVFVGAIPGAIPFMLGWVAATGSFGIEPGTLFMIQFFWQFPHFWALGWMLDEDYKRGGFKMLPTGNKDQGAAMQIILYTLWMIVISIVPSFGVTGRLFLSIPAVILVGFAGITMLIFGLRLYNNRSNQAAKQLMLVSVSYITLIQIIFVIDKFFRYLWI